MTTDVIDLRDFYASPLGNLAQKDIQTLLKKTCPIRTGQVILGFGYVLPFLEMFNIKKNTVYSFMPAHQGVLGWPPHQPKLSALVEEDIFPLPDRSIDQLVGVHALENCHNPKDFLEEAWRILKPDGSMTLVVPNRRGLWTCIENNPFGYGHPYTMTQLSKILRIHSFTPTLFCRGLYTPPSTSKILSFISPALEKAGSFFLQKFSGLICIQAVKQVYAPSGPYKRLRISMIPEAVRPIEALSSPTEL